jgi:hypothetical protein
MSSAYTPNLALKFLQSGQAEGHKVVNLDLVELDALVNGMVLSRTQSTPPTPSNGDRYIVGNSPGGDWVDFLEGDLVVYATNSWVAYTPKSGWTAWVDDEQVVVRHDGSEWGTYTGECIFSSRSAAGMATIDGTARYIPWDNDDRVGSQSGTSSVFTHSTSSSNTDITLEEAGDYLVEVQASFNATAGAAAGRCELILVLAGSDVTGSISYVVVNSSTITHGTVSIVFMLSNVSSGSILKVKATRGAGSGTINMPANTARISITRK